MELHNCMEDAVKRCLDKMIVRYDNICKCDKCKLDISAITLNNLSPRYVVTEQGKVFTKLDEMEPQYDVDVTRELTKAIQIVSKSPHHDFE